MNLKTKEGISINCDIYSLTLGIQANSIINKKSTPI